MLDKENGKEQLFYGRKVHEDYRILEIRPVIFRTINRGIHKVQPVLLAVFFIYRVYLANIMNKTNI